MVDRFFKFCFGQAVVPCPDEVSAELFGAAAGDQAGDGNEAAVTRGEGILSPDTLPLNLARFMFLDPRSKDFFVQWGALADDLAAALRTESGRNPHDRAFNCLIGDLAAGSTDFSTRWARHNVRFHRTARKTLHNPLIGDIELTGDSLELPGEGLTLIAYTAEPGSHAQEQLDFLTSWSTTDKGQTEQAQSNSSTKWSVLS